MMKSLYSVVFSVIIIVLLIAPVSIHAQDEEHPLMELLSYIPDVQPITSQNPIISFVDYGALYRSWELVPPQNFSEIMDDIRTEDERGISFLSFYRRYFGMNLWNFANELEANVGFDIFDATSSLIVGQDLGNTSIARFVVGNFDVEDVETALEDNNFENIEIYSGEFAWAHYERSLSSGNPFKNIMRPSTILYLTPDLIINTPSSEIMAGFVFSIQSNSGGLSENPYISALAQTLLDTDGDLIQVEVINNSFSTRSFETVMKAYPDMDLDSLGELPEYSFVAIADLQLGEFVVHSIALTYDNEDEATQAGHEVAKRLENYDTIDLYDELDVTVLEPIVVEIDGVYVVLVSLTYPEIPREVLLEDRTIPIPIFGTWMEGLIIKPVFLPIWING